MVVKTKETIPTAITGAFFAGLTAAFAISEIVLPKPYKLMFPPWGVFITWAGYFAAGGGGKGQAIPTFKKMYVAILWGDIWGFAGAFLMNVVNPHATNLPLMVFFDGVIIFLVNQPILWGTRYWGPIKYTPAIFYGFATFFSTYYGGFGFIPGNIYAAFVSSFVVNAIGPVFGYLQVRTAMIREVST